MWYTLEATPKALILKFAYILTQIMIPDEDTTCAKVFTPSKNYVVIMTLFTYTSVKNSRVLLALHIYNHYNNVKRYML